MTKFVKILLAILYYLLQWTWGILQNLVGAVLMLAAGRGKARRYRLASVRTWDNGGSISLGMFILLDRSHGSDILAHEWGHTLQSIILGPLYLLVIGLPSVLWAGLPVFRKYRRTKKVPYDALYCEAWATKLGAVRRPTSIAPGAAQPGTDRPLATSDAAASPSPAPDNAMPPAPRAAETQTAPPSGSAAELSQDDCPRNTDQIC